MHQPILRAIGAALVLLFGSPAVHAQAAASDKRFELRAGGSILWFTGGHSRDTNFNVGVLPLDLGVGFRPTPDTSIALMARAGIVQYGAGLELSKTFAADFGHDGLVVHLSPQLIRDFIHCNVQPSGADQCDSATFLMAEVGLAWRWAFGSGGGFSIGAVATAGQQRIRYTGTSSNPGALDKDLAYGVLAPRFLFDF